MSWIKAPATEMGLSGLAAPLGTDDRFGENTLSALGARRAGRGAPIYWQSETGVPPHQAVNFAPAIKAPRERKAPPCLRDLTARTQP